MEPLAWVGWNRGAFVSACGKGLAVQSGWPGARAGRPGRMSSVMPRSQAWRGAAWSLASGRIRWLLGWQVASGREGGHPGSGWRRPFRATVSNRAVQQPCPVATSDRTRLRRGLECRWRASAQSIVFRYRVPCRPQFGGECGPRCRFQKMTCVPVCPEVTPASRENTLSCSSRSPARALRRSDG